MACVHKDSFICDSPELYYYLNHNFFREVPLPSGGQRWAWVNEDVPKGYVYQPEVETKPGSKPVYVSVPIDRK